MPVTTATYPIKRQRLRREYLAIKREELDLQESFLPKFENALPEKKVFRYFQLERKVGGQLEALLLELIPVIE